MCLVQSIPSWKLNKFLLPCCGCQNSKPVCFNPSTGKTNSLDMQIKLIWKYFANSFNNNENFFSFNVWSCYISEALFRSSLDDIEMGSINYNKHIMPRKNECHMWENIGLYRHHLASVAPNMERLWIWTPNVYTNPTPSFNFTSSIKLNIQLPIFTSNSSQEIQCWISN